MGGKKRLSVPIGRFGEGSGHAQKGGTGDHVKTIARRPEGCADDGRVLYARGKAQWLASSGREKESKWSPGPFKYRGEESIQKCASAKGQRKQFALGQPKRRGCVEK